MKNILINLFSQSLTVEDFNYFSNEIPTQFEIFNYHFAVEEMFPDIVEAIINNLIEELDIQLVDMSITLQTNVVDIGHFSAKYYAELLDAVVIIPKNTELLIDARNDYKFILKILSADSEKLRLQKVYVQDKNKLDLNYLVFLYRNHLFNEVEPINKFKPLQVQKMRYDLVFNMPEGTLETNFSLSKYYVPFKDMELNSTSYISNMYGMFLLIQFIYDLQDFSTKDKREYLEGLLINVYRLKKSDELIEYISEYLKSTRHPIDKFADFNYICMVIGDKWALKRQYAYLKENFDYLNPAQVYALLTNSVFYESQLDQIAYDGLYNDRLLIMKKLNQFWKKEIQIPKVHNRRKNRICIVAGQLLGINHSPTKFAIDYANMLKKYIPGAEVKIFVDDYASYSPNELTWMNIFSSLTSSSVAKVTKKYLSSEIEVYYSDNHLERKKRIQEDINAIVNFQPSIIYKMGSNYNLTTDLLYPFFPIVSHTMGGAEDCEFVDIFTGGYKNETMESMYASQGISDIEYIPHTVGIETPLSVEDKSRKQYGLNDTDFVLITVGNRLEDEITLKFVEQILTVLKTNKYATWLIVGVTNLSTLNEYQEFIKNNRIIFISYEKNLFDLYKICHIYVNPIRDAGGYSAAMAMKAALPIVSANPSSDVAGFIGEENCIEENQFIKEILLLANDYEYYKKKSNLMLDIIETQFSFKNTAEDLIQIFDTAQQKFKERKMKL